MGICCQCFCPITACTMHMHIYIDTQLGRFFIYMYTQYTCALVKSRPWQDCVLYILSIVTLLSYSAGYLNMYIIALIAVAFIYYRQIIIYAPCRGKPYMKFALFLDLFHIFQIHH